MDKIQSALIDPKWEWGKLDIDGTKFPFLALIHPDHGKIVCILNEETKKSLAEGLQNL